MKTITAPVPDIYRTAKSLAQAVADNDPPELKRLHLYEGLSELCRYFKVEVPDDFREVMGVA